MTDDEFDQLRDRIEALEDALGVDHGGGDGSGRETPPFGPKESADHPYRLVYSDLWVNVYEDVDGDYRLHHSNADEFEYELGETVLVTRTNDLHDHITEMIANE